MIVNLRGTVKYGGRYHPPGTELTMPDETAAPLIAGGVAVAVVTDTPQPDRVPPAETGGNGPAPQLSGTKKAGQKGLKKPKKQETHP